MYAITNKLSIFQKYDKRKAWACLGPIGPGPVRAHKFGGRRATFWRPKAGGLVVEPLKNHQNYDIGVVGAKLDPGPLVPNWTLGRSGP